ncbi:hypothetical protein JW877_04535 [bacterium]|nr:hypothetical protein [bacterium]
MKISGFSFVRNGIKLYYPVVESILSILPICHEFVIAVGKGDDDDSTREQIENIQSDKIRIIETEWDEKYFDRGRINSIQTDIALKECTGDWCFYLQADEVVHEQDLPVIQRRCEELLDDREVEGLIFNYLHFWGDYDHYLKGHGWYSKEIRIIRNDAAIHSWESAQSFRRFDNYEDPRQEKGHFKLKVAEVKARIFHYGWVRPPQLMQSKRKALDGVHWGKKASSDYYQRQPLEFDYGPLNRLDIFRDSHPAVMQKRIAELFWKSKLQYKGKLNKMRKPHKHERFKYRFLSFIENNFLGGRRVGEFKNYILLPK